MQLGIQFLMIIRVKFETHLMSYCGETVEHFPLPCLFNKNLHRQHNLSWHVNVMNRNYKLMKDNALFPAGYPALLTDGLFYHRFALWYINATVVLFSCVFFVK